MPTPCPQPWPVITRVLGAALTPSVDGTVVAVVDTAGGVVVVAAGVVAFAVAAAVVAAGCVVTTEAPVGGDCSLGTERADTSVADAAPANPSAASETMKRTRRSTRRSR